MIPLKDLWTRLKYGKGFKSLLYWQFPSIHSLIYKICNVIYRYVRCLRTAMAQYTRDFKWGIIRRMRILFPFGHLYRAFPCLARYRSNTYLWSFGIFQINGTYYKIFGAQKKHKQYSHPLICSELVDKRKYFQKKRRRNTI